MNVGPVGIIYPFIFKVSFYLSYPEAQRRESIVLSPSSELVVARL